MQAARAQICLLHLSLTESALAWVESLQYELLMLAMSVVQAGVDVAAGLIPRAESLLQGCAEAQAAGARACHGRGPSPGDMLSLIQAQCNF